MKSFSFSRHHPWCIHMQSPHPVTMQSLLTFLSPHPEAATFPFSFLFLYHISEHAFPNTLGFLILSLKPPSPLVYHVAVSLPCDYLQERLSSSLPRLLRLAIPISFLLNENKNVLRCPSGSI